MTEAKFLDFWDNIFLPRANQLCRQFSCLRFDGTQRDLIRKTFEDMKPDVKIFMHNPDGLMDRHKVAALFVDVILTKRPFTTSARSSESIKNRFTAEFMPNEVWAWLCAKDIVYSFIQEKNHKSNNVRLMRMWKKGFVYPSCDHGIYEEHVFRSLYLSTARGNFDIFSFSHVLFFLEKYTLKTREQELITAIS